MSNDDSTEDGDLFVADTERWVNVGRIKGDTGNPGAAGKNAYVHIKFANSLTANDWTANNGETPGEYIGIYADNNPTDSTSWSDYKWMKWTGQDGLGYEFIYKRTASNSAPSTPTDINQTDGFVPSGWTDDPTGVTSSYPYEWVCYRKKTEGAWGAFIGSASNNAVAALWAKYGQNGSTGQPGNYTEYRFAVNGSTTTPPALVTNALNPSGWSTAMPTVNKGYYLWMTKAVKNGNGTSLVSTWSTPVRMTPQDGKDGKDGVSPALVFRGTYSSSKTYYGNQYRVDCVLYNGAYYVARADAGTFSNTAPTDTSKWNQFGSSFESVATGLLLAENANIAGWIFRGGKLYSQSGNCWLDGQTGNVNIKGDFIGKISTTSSGNRILIDPSTNAIHMYTNYYGKDIEVMRIESEDIGVGLRRPKIIMHEISTSDGQIMGTLSISAYGIEFYRYGDTSQPFFKIEGGWSSKKIILGDLALPTTKPSTKGQIWRNGDTLKIVT